MFLPPEEIERCFGKVANVRAYLNQRFPNRHMVALNFAELAQAISDKSQLTVQVCAVAAPGKLVAGTVERYRDGNVLILVKHELADDLLRFVVVKELCHLVIDDEPDWTTNAVKTVKEVKAEFDLARQNGDGVSNPSRTQMSEHLAIVSAVALMYPCETHEADMLKVFNRETTIARIAMEYQMPPWTIELAFTKGEVFELYPIAG